MIVRHRYPSAGIDRAFEQLTNSLFDTRRQVGPVVTGAWQHDEYVLTVDLPGVAADAVTVEVTGPTLMLSATTDAMDWQHSLRIGGRLDPDQVHAHHVDGRLTVRIGTIEEPAARSIPVATTPPPAAIEATADSAGDSVGDSVGDEPVGDEPAIS